MYAIGIDIGGSHISCVAVNLGSGEIKKESYSEIKVNSKSSAKDIISTWAIAIQSTIDTISIDKIAGLGIAMPGPFDYKKGISEISGVDKYDTLMGLDVAQALRNELDLPHNFTIRFINDAFAFGIGESWNATKNNGNSIALTLGTGYGSAFLVQGVPTVTPPAPALGFIYHIPYREGIADAYVSIRWFETEAQKRLGFIPKGGVKELASMARENAQLATLFKEYGQSIGNTIGSYARDLNAQEIVFGGNLTGASDLFFAEIESILFSLNVQATLRISTLKEWATFKGAARLIDDLFYNSLKKNIY